MAIVLNSNAIAEPFAGYAALAASVARWTHRTDLGDMIPEFLRLAEARIGKDLQLASQLVTVPLVQAAGVRGVLLPDDWQAFKSLARATEPDRLLAYVPLEKMAVLEREQGYPSPRAYTIDGFTLITGPVVAAPYTLTVRYYARIPSLLLVDSNWLILNHPGIYLWSVLTEAMLYTQNVEQMAAYQQRYQQEVAQLIANEQRAASSGSSLRIRTR
jgi:hypothetical protein